MSRRGGRLAPASSPAQRPGADGNPRLRGFLYQVNRGGNGISGRFAHIFHAVSVADRGGQADVPEPAGHGPFKPLFVEDQAGHQYPGCPVDAADQFVAVRHLGDD